MRHPSTAINVEPQRRFFEKEKQEAEEDVPKAATTTNPILDIWFGERKVDEQVQKLVDIDDKNNKEVVEFENRQDESSQPRRPHFWTWRKQVNYLNAEPLDQTVRSIEYRPSYHEYTLEQVRRMLYHTRTFQLTLGIICLTLLSCLCICYCRRNRSATHTGVRCMAFRRPQHGSVPYQHLSDYDQQVISKCAGQLKKDGKADTEDLQGWGDKQQHDPLWWDNGTKDGGFENPLVAHLAKNGKQQNVQNV